MSTLDRTTIVNFDYKYGLCVANGAKDKRYLGAVIAFGLDPHICTVALNGVLDECEPQTGSTLCAALSNVHAVEPLREPRQMLRIDARAVIRHGDQIGGWAHVFERRRDTFQAARLTFTCPPSRP